MNRHGNEGAGKERRRAVPVEEGGRGGYHSGGGALGRWSQCDDVNLRRRTPLKKMRKKMKTKGIRKFTWAPTYPPQVNRKSK